jgi:hypothetical protein
MRSRKTVNVEAVKETANQLLERTDKYAIDGEFKAGVCTMIERILHDTGNYRGFYFINPDARPNDEDYYARRYF